MQFYFIQKISTFFAKANKKYLKILLVLLVGAFGIFLIAGTDSSLFDDKQGVDEPIAVAPSTADYENEIEEKVMRLCSSTRGVGKACAVVMLDGEYTAVYAQDSQTSGNGYRNEFVLVGGGANQSPLLIGYKPPDIVGIGIICEGGGDEYVKIELISLVSATFGISPSKIYVASAKK